MSKHQPVVIFKKIRSHSDHLGHGAWKIAYADFMTAMMALFLVMWITSSASTEERHQLAEYFTHTFVSSEPTGNQELRHDSIIPGGGNDITRPSESDNTMISEQSNQVLQDLRNQLEVIIETDPRLNNFKSNLLLAVTSTGLYIQITDDQKRPMFKTGEKIPEEYLIKMLQALIPVLNGIPHRLTITGHTDATPYVGGERGYSNWELSADRANAVRQVMMEGGLMNDKILQIIGVANNMAADRQHPSLGINRRITLLVLSPEHEKMVVHEEGFFIKN